MGTCAVPVEELLSLASQGRELLGVHSPTVLFICFRTQGKCQSLLLTSFPILILCAIVSCYCYSRYKNCCNSNLLSFPQSPSKRYIFFEWDDFFFHTEGDVLLMIIYPGFIEFCRYVGLLFLSVCKWLLLCHMFVLYSPHIWQV